MFDFDALSHAMISQTVLCVGDLMLDEFVYGEVSRISPEAPAPVIAVQRSETNIGGAGNVARNIASLGARCIFIGLIGEDEAGAKLQAQLAQAGPGSGMESLADMLKQQIQQIQSSLVVLPDQTLEQMIDEPVSYTHLTLPTILRV